MMYACLFFETTAISYSPSLSISATAGDPQISLLEPSGNSTGKPFSKLPWLSKA